MAVHAPQTATDKAELTLPDGRKFLFNIVEATHGAQSLDVSGLFKESGGLTLLNPSYGDIAACKSQITYVDGKGDGQKATLLYRGIPIEQLAVHASYLETSYLLFHGELPTPDQLADFTLAVRSHGDSHPEIESFIKAMPITKHTHPMGMLGSAVEALHALYPTQSRSAAEMVREYFPVFLAQLPILAAQCHRHRTGQEFIPPNKDLPTLENFLHMMFGDANQSANVSPIHVETLEKIMILHADHEQNASTTVVRNITSANSNPFAAVTGGIGALWGTLHGGANEKVVEMLLSIHLGGGDINAFIERAKGASDPKDRLMGFGHRIYEEYDPRAAVMKELAERYFKIHNNEDPLLNIAKRLEELAVNDLYFTQRKLYPNVDFYSGILLRAMGFPSLEFTVIFALGRTAGWLAQAYEQASDPKSRIARPRQVYVGPPLQNFPYESTHG